MKQTQVNPSAVVLGLSLADQATGYLGSLPAIFQ